MNTMFITNLFNDYIINPFVYNNLMLNVSIIIAYMFNFI